MMICSDCGNTESFEKELVFVKYVKEIASVDGETEEEIEYEAQETFHEERESEEDTYCENCKSKDIEIQLNEEQILEYKCRRTDKNGKWHKEDLPIEDRCEKLKKQAITQKV